MIILCLFTKPSAQQDRWIWVVISCFHIDLHGRFSDEDRLVLASWLARWAFSGSTKSRFMSSAVVKAKPMVEVLPAKHAGEPADFTTVTISFANCPELCLASPFFPPQNNFSAKTHHGGHLQLYSAIQFRLRVEQETKHLSTHCCSLFSALQMVHRYQPVPLMDEVKQHSNSGYNCPCMSPLFKGREQIMCTLQNHAQNDDECEAYVKWIKQKLYYDALVRFWRSKKDSAPLHITMFFVQSRRGWENKTSSEMKTGAQQQQQQPCVPIGSDNPICFPGAIAVNRVYFMGLEDLGRDVRSKVKDSRRGLLTLRVHGEVQTSQPIAYIKPTHAYVYTKFYMCCGINIQYINYTAKTRSDRVTTSVQSPSFDSGWRSRARWVL